MLLHDKSFSTEYKYAMHDGSNIPPTVAMSTGKSDSIVGSLAYAYFRIFVDCRVKPAPMAADRRGNVESFAKILLPSHKRVSGRKEKLNRLTDDSRYG